MSIGDQGLTTLFPMFMIDLGLDVGTVAFWTGFVGQILSLCGSILGGIITKTMTEAIQILLVMQAICLIVLWAVVAVGSLNEDIVYVISLFFLMSAYLASGGVTTCTFTLIMQLSQRVPRRHRTSHYTLLATSEVAGRLLASTITGMLTDHTSYLFTFGLLSFTSVFVVPYAMTVPNALIISS